MHGLRCSSNELLEGRDVLRVRFGVWAIRAEVDDGDARHAHVLTSLDTRAEPGSWRPPYAIELARIPKGLTRGVDSETLLRVARSDRPRHRHVLSNFAGPV